MQGFMLYMIVGAVITAYRFGFSNNAYTVKIAKPFMEKYNDYPSLIQIVLFLVLSFLALPTLIADYLYFAFDRIQMKKYNSKKVKEDVYIYVYAGLLHAEAVSYSSYNRFSEQEAADIETTFKKAEALIIAHGFIPLTVGNFVEFYQDGKPLPHMRIKGRVYEDVKA